MVAWELAGAKKKPKKSKRQRRGESESDDSDDDGEAKGPARHHGYHLRSSTGAKKVRFVLNKRLDEINEHAAYVCQRARGQGGGAPRGGVRGSGAPSGDVREEARNQDGNDVRAHHNGGVPMAAMRNLAASMRHNARSAEEVGDIVCLNGHHMAMHARGGQGAAGDTIIDSGATTPVITSVEGCTDVEPCNDVVTVGGGEQLRCSTRATKFFTAQELGGTVPIEVRRCLVILIPDMGISVLPVCIFTESGCEIGMRRTRHGETQMRIDLRRGGNGGGSTVVARLTADATGLFRLNRPRAEQEMAAIALEQDNAAVRYSYGEQEDDTESDEGEALALRRLAAAVRGQLLRVGCRPPQDDGGNASDSDDDEARPGGGPSVGGRGPSRGGNGGCVGGAGGAKRRRGNGGHVYNIARTYNSTTTQDEILLYWHRKLGHRNFVDLVALLNEWGIPIKLPRKAPYCEHCVQAKSTRAPAASTLAVRYTAPRPGYILYSDSFGKFAISTRSGYDMFNVIVDGASRRIWLRLDKAQSNFYGHLVDVVLELEAEFGREKVMARLHTDGHSTFRDGRVIQFCKGRGIKPSTCPPFHA